MRVKRPSELAWIPLQPILKRLAKDGYSAGMIEVYFKEEMGVEISRCAIAGRCSRTGIKLKAKHCLPPNPGGGRQKQEMCCSGLHRLEGDNVYLQKKGGNVVSRSCKACRLARARKRYKEKQERQAA